MDEAAALANHSRAAMVAPAGCGKTEVIATAVAKYAGKRELVLTHTHAGIEAIRGRLRKLGAPARTYRVTTIAGWALGLATAFPKTSALPNEKPRTNPEYSATYRAATKLLALKPIQEIVRASYSGAYVDEYQDCTVQQHDLVMAILSVLPCRIVGDPLQGIFNFGENESIKWNEHVEPFFEKVSGPSTPWRWATSNPQLGEWLKLVRGHLERGEDIDLRNAPMRWVDGSDQETKQRNQLAACFKASNKDGETTIAIHQWPSQCHSIAKNLKGVYSCVEAIDTKDLYDYARRFDTLTGFDRALAVIDFVSKCMTKVRSELKTIRNAFEKDRIPNVQKHRECLEALRAVSDENSMTAIESALQHITKIPGAVVYRRELLREMIRSVRALHLDEATTLTEAAWLVRNRTRQRGRILPTCAVGTTLLVKGLEFDHAIVLDADVHDRQNLYVALTRGSKTLTIVSRSHVLKPSQNATTD